MTDSLVVKRLSRNLRYKRTYIQIYQDYLEPEPVGTFLGLLRSLTEAQRAAIVSLERCLDAVGPGRQDDKPYEKLRADAAKRTDLRSRLRFLHAGLTRSVAWYKMQMTDQRMTADPRLKNLLIELGEIEAAQLWRTEAAMHLIRIPVQAGQPDEAVTPGPPIEGEESWRSGLVVEEKGRPDWGGFTQRPPRPDRRRRER